MAERIPQSVAKRVAFRAYLSSDGKTLATGKTIAITISKNGGLFGNPAAGVTNATEISSGFYYFDLGTGDTGTTGPLAWRGAEASINDAGDAYEVANAHNAGFDGVPNATAGANGGVPTVDANNNLHGLQVGTGTGQLNSSGGKVPATIASGDGVDAATLLTRLTSARAGYLDNLNVGGAVASHADIVAINQSASKHLLLTTIGQYVPGETYTIECRTYSAVDGTAVNADTTPTLTATGNTSGNLSGNLSAATNPSTGVYRWTYTPGASPTLEQIRMDVSATISSVVYTLSAYTQTVDEASVVWTATDQSHLTSIYNKLPTNNIADETLLLTAVGTPMQAGASVALSVSQPNYAPAKAGDAMALISAYDAAKTAAQASVLAANYAALLVAIGTPMQAGALVTLLNGQLVFKKDVGISGYTFPMFNAANPQQLLSGLSGQITLQRSIDGNSYANVANMSGITEIGTSGTYKVDLANTDMNGGGITFLATAVGAIELPFTLYTQP